MPKPPPAKLRDEEVVAAIAVIFGRFDKVETQHRLRKLVQEELAKRRPGVKVGSARVRLLAVRSGIVRPETRTKTAEGIEGLEDCPVCKSKLRRIRNRTLKGGTVLVGMTCPQCSYKTGTKMQVPTKYVFHRR